MTISVPTQLVYSSDGDGATSQFSYPVRILEAGEIVVLRRENGVDTTLTLNTDYTLSGIGDAGGVTITMLSVPTAGQEITRYRATAPKQIVDLKDKQTNPAEAVEQQLDRLAMVSQDHEDAIERAVKLPVGNPTDTEGLAESLLRLADSADEIDTVAGISADVTTVAGVATDVTAVAVVADSVPAVAGVADDIPTVAGIADDVSTVATNVADITNFSDVYLGAKATEPTTRNDDSALQAGDQYFDTTNDKLKIYTGSAWVGGTGDMVFAEDVLDEDDMASDSATKVPTQQSVKAKIDNDTILKVADRTALKAVDTTKHTAAYLREGVPAVQGRFGQFIWDSANLSTEVSADPREGIYVPTSTDATGASGAWVRVFEGPAQVEWFFDTADTDYSEAFQAACNVGYGDVAFGPRVYNISTGAVVDQDIYDHVRISGAGEGLTQIIYGGTGDFLKFTRTLEVNATSHRVAALVERMDILVSTLGTATAINFDLDDTSPQPGAYDGYRRRISNVRLKAANLASSWAGGLRLKNVSYIDVENFYYRNNGGTAIYITGTKAGVSNRFDNIKIISADKGIYCDAENNEGTYCHNLDIIDTLVGVEYISVGNNPMLVISDSHISIFDYAIKVKNLTSVLGSNLVLYALETDAIAVSIDSSDDAPIRGHSFTNVDIFGNKGSNGAGYKFLNKVNGASIVGGSVSGCTTGVSIGAQCDGIKINPSVDFVNNTADVVNASPTSTWRKFDSRTGTMENHFQTESTFVEGAASNPFSKQVFKSRGVPGTPLVVQSGDKIKRDTLWGYDGAKYVSAGYVEWGVNGTPGIDDMPGYVAIGVTDDGQSVATERWRINQNGAVITKPPSTGQGPVLSNGQMTWELTNDTTLTFRAKGSDGVARSGTITLT